MNYATLLTTVQQYVENYETSFVDSIPTFVQLAEERIYNSMQLPATRTNVTGSLTSGNKYLTLPPDWLSTFSVAVIDGTTGQQSYLLNKDVDFIREAFPYPATTGQPTHYAIFDQNTLIVGPTPDASYGIELHYYAYPQSIVTAGTSWLGDNFESVLLYGTLREAYVNMKGEDSLQQKYEALYQEALSSLKQLADGKNRRDTYRSGQTRVPVA